MARYLALTGGVGGAKLALGLAHVLSADELVLMVNTGDDFSHYGLHICPDLDTLMYTLCGEANLETGWGRQSETWQFMDALRALGGEDWFNLGDRDLATHLLRTQRLKEGASLTEVTRALCNRFGIEHAVYPMSDDPVPTIVETPDGELPFQHYFVRDRCAPSVTGFRFEGVERARPSAAVMKLLAEDRIDGVVICPSNPFVSVDPLLHLPGLRAALEGSPAPVVAVSPIVGGQAIKGPTAKMMRELHLPTSALEVARHYGSLLDGFVLDACDQHLVAEIEATGLRAIATQSVMVTLADRIGLARDTLKFLETLK